MLLSERSQGMDFEPWQCHFFRDRLFGEFGSDFQSPLILALRAQYASPLAVPGRMRSPPSAALPACPNLTVRSRPVFGFTIVFEKRFSISESRLKIQGSRVKSFKGRSRDGVGEFSSSGLVVYRLSLSVLVGPVLVALKYYACWPESCNFGIGRRWR